MQKGLVRGYAEQIESRIKCASRDSLVPLNALLSPIIYTVTNFYSILTYLSPRTLNPTDPKSLTLECRNCPSVFTLSNFTWSL